MSKALQEMGYLVKAKDGAIGTDKLGAQVTATALARDPTAPAVINCRLLKPFSFCSSSLIGPLISPIPPPF